MTDDELLATVLRRFLKEAALVDIGENVAEPFQLIGNVKVSRDEHAALMRELRILHKAGAVGNGQRAPLIG